MTPERAHRMASWLMKLADQEDQTAEVLDKLPRGDSKPCRTKARLFREIAVSLTEPVEPPPPPEAATVQPTPEPPPAPAPGKRRAPL